MKKIALSILSLALVSACVTQPIKEQLEGKSNEEKKQVLLRNCIMEANNGHDSYSHDDHYKYMPENRKHQDNVRKICNELANSSGNKQSLIQECKTEAGAGIYANKDFFSVHKKRLNEICDGFAEVQ